MSSTFERIVCLVPSLTELLIDLGLEEQIIGRTRFCIHPEDKVDQIPIIGGTKNPRIEDIIEMQPDIVIANKEENRKEDIEALRSHVPIELTDIASIEDALITIHEMGKLFDVSEKAHQLINDITEAFEDRPDEYPLQTAYLIWRDPYMSVGNDTYIHDILQKWNLTNAFGNQKRYPEVTGLELRQTNLDLILLSSEPYPFKEKHLKEIEELNSSARVMLVDGEWFSWYGSRMLKSFKELNLWRKAIS
jgi:ABC-type Fe3+-hydroxamate transport system substrate-binding protein